MAQRKTIAIDAPAQWACAMINLDYSGLTKEDRAELNNWLANEGLSFADCVDCTKEDHYGQFNGLGRALLTYTFFA